MLFLNKKPIKIILGSFIIIVAGIYLLGYGIMKYEQWHGQKRIEELKQELERIEREQYEKEKADTVGGKTPLETLNLYIEAVEKGDYELASKYFVIEKQQNELKSLQNSPKENVMNIMDLIKKTRDEFNRFSGQEKTFSVHNPILVSFVLYPSGNWKIEEI